MVRRWLLKTIFAVSAGHQQGSSDIEIYPVKPRPKEYLKLGQYSLQP